MSKKINHVRQVKTDSFTRAVAPDVLWIEGLDEMQMVMTMLINIIKANIHEHIRSITLK